MDWGSVRYPFRVLASGVGYAITAYVVWWQWSVNFGGHLPPDLGIWDRVGDQVRSGVSPYSVADLSWTGFFFYAPPWALGFALTSWLPTTVQAGLVFAIEAVALRYVAGSWLRVGYLGLIPITGAELGNGSFNLLVAAGIAAAIRGDGRLAALMSLAKISPILAVSDYRRVAITLAAACALTLPVLGWWSEWVSLLAWTNANFRIGYNIPLVPRFAVALGLVLLVRRPWARGLAAVIAIPAVYSYSLVLLYALIPAKRRGLVAVGPGRPSSVAEEAPPTLVPASIELTPATLSAAGEADPAGREGETVGVSPLA